MFRAALLLIALAGLTAPAFACDMRLASRPAGVAAYVEAAGPCLIAPPEGLAFDASLEAQFLGLVNDERRRAGLPPISLRTNLSGAARFHSLDMAANTFFGHDGRDGRSPQDRIAAFDRTALASFTAENVASLSRPGGRLSPDFALRRLHQNLMDSPGHRANILDPRATHAAFGVVRTRDSVWVTQLFMGLAGTLPQEAPLRIAAPNGLGAPSGLEGWQFVRYEIVSPTGDPWPSGVRLGPGLSARLAAYATQPRDGRGSFTAIRFTGPAITIER
ncbi:CAP domain-containing protein [Hyphomonas sp.]|uniref:CAP domain-containing protein n=1 Tax=Hyphomonas sp. TaxID=87 RepID=UPI00391B31CD